MPSPACPGQPSRTAPGARAATKERSMERGKGNLFGFLGISIRRTAIALIVAVLGGSPAAAQTCPPGTRIADVSLGFQSEVLPAGWFDVGEDVPDGCYPCRGGKNYVCDEGPSARTGSACSGTGY